MIEGWRGRIARSIPEPLVRKHLVNTIGSRRTGHDVSIEQARREDRDHSLALARNLGLGVSEVQSSSTFCIQSSDWRVLERELGRAGFKIDKLHQQQSYAAESTWSVSTKSQCPANRLADLRGMGALWQVFPGPIEPSVDAQDFNEKVDAVYTWVDSGDPSWAASYHRELERSGKNAITSATDIARFTSRDELLYSLRSLEMNLPWIDKVFLVTAGQRPDWLVNNHPKLTLVDHREIFNPSADCLPTFNSHAIESQLANIPGLKEHFLYVNDDVFFGRYLHPNTFFGPAGQAKYCLAEGHFALAEDQQLPVNRAAANNRNIVVAEFARTTSRKFQHVAHPQRLAVHQRIAATQAAAINEISRNRFRSESDLSIPSSLAHQFAARMGLGYPSNAKYQYVDIGSDAFTLEMLRLARNTELDMFCINEVLSADDEENRSAVVRDLLDAKFPVKCSFEK